MHSISDIVAIAVGGRLYRRHSEGGNTLRQSKEQKSSCTRRHFAIVISDFLRGLFPK